METEKNSTRDMVDFSYEGHRADKSKELKSSMSIVPQGRDSLESKIHSVGGND